MPIYEYRCRSCGHELEKLQRMSDPALTDCPACNESELQRLVSAVAFRLKGSGWYETDFKTGEKKQLAESDSAKAAASSDSSTSTSGVAAKSETKPKSATGNKDATSKAKPAKSSAKKSS